MQRSCEIEGGSRSGLLVHERCIEASSHGIGLRGLVQLRKADRLITRAARISSCRSKRPRSVSSTSTVSPTPRPAMPSERRTDIGSMDGTDGSQMSKRVPAPRALFTSTAPSCCRTNSPFAPSARRSTGSHVPYESLVELRAAYMPDVARAVSGIPRADPGGDAMGRRRGYSIVADVNRWSAPCRS
jgi:hypothetical protein